jgi:formylglycine-generating enzyme required for sulfatase activity
VRASPRGAAAALVLLALGVALAVAISRRGEGDHAQCGPGFVARRARCWADPDALVLSGPRPSGRCPAPLVRTPLGCDAPDVRVLVPETTVVLGPSDWEAEGLVEPRTLHVHAFRIDAFEVTRGRWDGAADDPARAATGMTRAAAEVFCTKQAPGGRLPTEDEWIAAAVAGASPAPRYPWGDTGAVCRRAAWGLAVGPCAQGADGPDTVGAHPDGDSSLGLHDLAGNAAEWVQSGRVKGGSWATALAADLRLWAALELPAGAADPRVGLRCAYPP